MLGNQISDIDLNCLVLTKHYELLLARADTLSSTEMEVQQVANGLVALELNERVEAFDAAIKALNGQISQWSAYAHYVVPDTSFSIEHGRSLRMSTSARRKRWPGPETPRNPSGAFLRRVRDQDGEPVIGRQV